MTCCGTSLDGVHEAYCGTGEVQAAKRAQAWQEFREKFAPGTRVVGAHPRSLASLEGRMGTVVRRQTESRFESPGPFTAVWVQWDQPRPYEPTEVCLLATWLRSVEH